MVSVNVQCDLKVRLQETSNKGNKRLLLRPTGAFGKSSVGKFDCQNGVLRGVKGARRSHRSKLDGL